MRILVTGAHGFIGKHTCDLLIKEGHSIFDVDIADHLPNKTNILDFPKLSGNFEWFKPDAVLHLAANSSLRKGIEDPVYDAMNNIIGTLNVLKAMKESGCNRIVFASTSAVYDPFEDPPFIESTLLYPITPYGISKLSCEMYIRTLAPRYVILRYGNVYGPGQTPLGENILIARAIAHMIDGEPFKVNGDGQQERDFIYVEDVARANLLALTNPVNFVGSLNVSTGRGTSVNQVVRSLKRLTLHRGKIERGPEIKGETRVVIMKSDAIEKRLGWLLMINLEKGLKRTVESWMSSQDLKKANLKAST